MPNWSLVCFTLLTQSAIGLGWVTVAGRWFGGGTPADHSIWSMLIALALVGLGLFASLAHLARPRLAPHALRNLTASWLSREVLLVQTFGGTVVLLILLLLIDASMWLVIFEIATCLLGGAVLFIMIRVYLIKTVPAWNSPATLLEFVGSVMLLGSTLGAVIMSFEASGQPSWSPALMTAGIGVLVGLMLKLTAISPAMTAEQAARSQAWYATPGASPATGRVLTVRMALNLAGLLLILAAMGGYGPARLWSSLSLACFATGEVIGRAYFYNAYSRVGL